jgi:hypothetical protein
MVMVSLWGCAHDTRVADEPPPEEGWWCFTGVVESSKEVGTCDRSLDVCAKRLEIGAAKGVAMQQPTCQRQTESTCYAAYRVLEGAREIQCFPNATVCETFHESSSANESYRDHTPCLASR